MCMLYQMQHYMILPHHCSSMQMSHNHNIQLLPYTGQKAVLPIHTQKYIAIDYGSFFLLPQTLCLM